VNEPCDCGADYSTFEFFRSGDVPPIPKDPFGLPHTTERFVRPSKDYSWSSVVDHMGVEQALGIIGGHYRDVSYPMPRFLWCNFTLTDAAMHEGGPYSEIAAAAVRDCDGRIGEILAALERARAMDLSDQWVLEGCQPGSPLLALERAALVRSYAALLAAVHHEEH